jgi:hypothetical protein
MKVQKKLLKLKQQLFSNEKNIPIYNLAEEEVQKLDINDNISSPLIFWNEKDLKIGINNNLIKEMPSKILKIVESKEKKPNSQFNTSTNSTNEYNNFNEDDLAFNNNLTTSIEKLKKIIPDINEKMKNNYSGIFDSLLPKKDYKVENNETYLNSVLTELNEKEIKMKNKKNKMENELNNIEKEINDKLFYIELMKDANFQQNLKTKIINQFEKEFNESKNKEILKDINNTKISPIDKKDLFSIKNKYKNEKEIKEQKIEEAKQKSIEKTIMLDELREKTYKTKLNNLLLSKQISIKKKTERFTNDIIRQKERKKIIWQKVKIYHDKLKKLHTLQNKIKDNLYIYYLSILKDGVDTRDEGLSWVIAEILKLGKKVLISYIPKYLDEKSILYLFIKAHLILKIKYLEKRINESNDDCKERKDVKKKTKRYNAKLIARKTLNNIKEKFMHNKLENSNINMPYIENNKNISFPISLKKYETSKLFLKDSDKKLSKSNSMIYFKHQNNYLEGEKEKNSFIDAFKKKLFLKKNKKISFEEYISMSDEIKKLKKLKESLKEKEMERIFEEFRLNKYSTKYNIDKKNILSALIGEQNIEKELSIQDKKEKQLNKESIKTKLYTNNYLINKSMLMKKGSMMLKKI